jgi:signal peptidase I
MRLLRPRRGGIFELVLVVATALLLAFAVQAFAMKPYRIPSPSMEPTLDVGQRVLVNRIPTRLGSHPGVGDIIVFHPPVGADSETCGAEDQGDNTATPCSEDLPGGHSRDTYIKRVVGVAGDRIEIRDGHVIRNGVRQSEPFARSCTGTDCTFGIAVTVPKGSVYVMGDNRGNSSDSRIWGPVPTKWIIGTAVVTYWPPRRVGTL